MWIGKLPPAPSLLPPAPLLLPLCSLLLPCSLSAPKQVQNFPKIRKILNFLGPDHPYIENSVYRDRLVPKILEFSHFGDILDLFRGRNLLLVSTVFDLPGVCLSWLKCLIPVV